MCQIIQVMNFDAVTRYSIFIYKFLGYCNFFYWLSIDKTRLRKYNQKNQ